MSQWTHVAGIVRFDGIYCLGMPEPDLGKTASFDDSESAFDNCTVPCGSEGSLTCEMWKNPETNQLSARTAYIFGDLRDYDDADEIIGYFNRITTGEGIMVRNACYVIDVEGFIPRTFTYVEGSFLEQFNHQTV